MTIQRVYLFVLFAVIISACTGGELTGVPAPKDKLDEIRARGIIVIATDASYPPQSQLKPLAERAAKTKCESFQYTENQMQGFDVAVGVKIANALGVEPCFVSPPWSQLIAGNWQNNWDIHVGSVAITYDRMENLYFTQPYYATPTVVLVHEDSAITRAEDLSGMRIGVCSGCVPEKYLLGSLRLPGQEVKQVIKDALVVAYENESPAIKDLAAGQSIYLDAVITILPTARDAIASGKPLRMLEMPLLFGYASVTVDKKGSRDPARLIAEINKTIQGLHTSGKLRELSIQHMGMDLTSEAALFDIANLEVSR